MGVEETFQPFAGLTFQDLFNEDEEMPGTGPTGSGGVASPSSN